MKTATIKLTAAVGIAGVLCRAGEIVTVPEAAAKNLLHRGKAELATAADDPAPEAPETSEGEGSDGDGDPDPAPADPETEPEAESQGKPAKPGKPKK